VANGITAGPDGGVWFTASHVLIDYGDNSSEVGRIDPITHAIATFPVAVGPTLSAITAGPDGSLWFIENKLLSIFLSSSGNGFHINYRYSSGIGRIDPATHAIAEFPLPTANSFLGGITAGSDGGVWFAAGNEIGQAVLLTETRTQLVAAPDPSDPGQAVTFTAVVTPASGAEPPPGAVTFAIDGVAQAPVPLTVVNGQARATLITTTLAPGRHNIVASYGGGGAFLASASDSVTQVVRPPATRTQLFAAPDPSDPGQAVTFTAVVTPASGAEPPPGAVTFAIDGVAQAPVPLIVVNGQARATLITTTLAPGQHHIVASYGGDGAFSASASDTVTQVVRPPAPQVLGLARYGVRWDATRIVLTFDQPMFAPSVEYVNNYAVLTNPYYHNQVVRVVSAAYDPATHTVTLIPAIRLNIHYDYTLIINGHGPYGAMSAAGLSLDGAGNGTGGTNYVKSFGSESVVWPRPMMRPWLTPRPLVSRLPKPR
jgi:hypothetical protein